MNKTLSIALAGFSFVIDEHAYIKLSDYLNALRRSLDATEADEVMHDIEIRMVEIFKESLGKREVINDSDVERVIAQIGTPEQIDEQEEAYFSESKQSNKRTNNNTYSRNEQKQLFRDPGNQRIAGVCSGLAAYFDIETSWMRLIWVGTFILLIIAPGSSFLVILLYVILWMVLPKAETASDYLKMKGKPLNFDNLKEESSKIVQFANESTQRVGEIYTENKKHISSAGSSLWNVFKYFFAIMVAIMTAGCFIGLFVLIAAFNSGKFKIDENLGFYLEENNLGYLMLGVAGIPVIVIGIAFLLLTIKLFSPKTKFNYISKILGFIGIIWLILVGILAYSASNINIKYSGYNEEEDNIAITTPSDSLILGTKKVNIPDNFNNYWNNIYSDKNTIYKHDYPSVNVIRKDGIKDAYLVVKKEAQGYNQPLKMSIPVEIVNNKILFPNYMSYPYANRFRKYNVDYDLVIPKHIVIIKEKDYGLSLRGDYDLNGEWGSDDATNNNQNGITIEKNKLQINGTTIEYSSADSDSIKINGTNYDKATAEKIIKSLNIDHPNLKDLNINIKNGEKEVSISTK